ncbi:MAG: hypothetical protein HY696_01125 [Deltaproteobacteria bacterium]|nr:hypothetical protein [Deltaproteobacteria bacterium]
MSKIPPPQGIHPSQRPAAHGQARPEGQRSYARRYAERGAPAAPLPSRLPGALWRGPAAEPAPVTALTLTHSRPIRTDLTALETTLRAVAAAWPRDPAGRLDLALLRRPVNLYLPLHFADDTQITLATLLSWHRTAYLSQPPTHRRPRGEVPIDSRSQDYLVWALRHVTADPTLSTTSPHREPTREVRVDCTPVASWTDLRSTRRVMRAILTQLTPLAGADAQEYWLVIPRQGRIRLSYVLRDYWHALRHRKIADGTLAPDITKEAIKEAALDIIYYDLFAEPRPHPRWKGIPTNVGTLAWPRGALVPTVDALPGALATAAAILRTPLAAPWTAFPRDSRGALVLVWPTGEVVRYRWFLHQLHYLLLETARRDAAVAARFFNPLPPPNATAYAPPTLDTRQSLCRTLRTLNPEQLLANPNIIALPPPRPRADGAQVLRVDANGAKVLTRRRSPHATQP